MSWLIDAEVLIEDIENNGDKAIIDMIESQPTAYDPEEVVKQLEDLPVKTTSKMVESKEVPEWFYEVKTGEFINKKDAIEIVRKGGVK